MPEMLPTNDDCVAMMPSALNIEDTKKVLVDARFGPVVSLLETRLKPPLGRWHMVSGNLARTPPGTPFQPHSPMASGVHLDRDVAVRSALGEAIERYSALSAPLDVVRRPAGEGGFYGRTPACAYDEPCSQSLRSFPAGTPLTHTPVRHLADNRVEYIPAGYIYLGFTAEPPEPAVTLSISTGLAFDPELWRALWRGLCEVIERDAMMLMWLRKMAAPRIVIDGTAPDFVHLRLAECARAGCEVYLFDITSDVPIPTVFCILLKRDGVYASAGACCHELPAAACAKAIDEAVSVRSFLKPYPDPVPVKDFTWMHQLEQHAAIYASPQTAPMLAFLIEDPPRISYERFNERNVAPPLSIGQVRAWAAELSGRGLDVVWASMTSDDLAHLGHVVKVVVPQMVPLSPSHSTRWLATPRLGNGTHGLTASTAIPVPHPFA
jgi:ribosomal protein S12 methylthiotransferase accessory factor